MITDNKIDEILKTLDAADAAIDAHAPQVRTRLDAIIAAEPAASTLVRVGRTAARPWTRRTIRRIGWGGGLVAAAAVTALVVPSLLGGGSQAFAGWDPTPHAIPRAQISHVVEACQDTTAGIISGPNRRATHTADGNSQASPPSLAPADPDSPAAQRVAAASVAVTEQRGPWTTVLIADDRGLWATCVKGPHGASAASASTDARAIPPGPNTASLVTGGHGYFLGDTYSMITGLVGEHVTGLSYSSADHGTVAATVSNGHFVLWMPGDEWATFPDRIPVTVTLLAGAIAHQDLTWP